MTREKISVLIPVHRESDLLEPLIESLLRDPYGEKEIFVIIDEPTQRSLDAAKRFSDKNVHFIFNGVRKGKANVLNEVAKRSRGDILLFLDSDVSIDGDGESFLESIVREMRNAEILEVKKGVIRDSFVAKIVSYDYLSFNLTSLFFSRSIGKCLGINGAAFAIKRDVFEELGGFRRVICEDLDMAVRSFTNGARFRFAENLIVYTRAPSSLREWFNQRKRWGIGAAFWFKENFKILKEAVYKYPKVIIPSLLLIFPALPVMLTNLFMPDDLSFKMLYLSLILMSSKANILLPPTALTSTTFSLLKNFLIVLGSLATYLLTFYLIARKLRLHFNPLEFIAFYFITAPLWLLIVIASLIRVYIKPDGIKIDWKV
ncbi:MAG: glycosyltransferase family 2 protein [Candidatus Bathyarchaeota archaeon]|nr:glycosyltransferase family 2 protein [Candidatus Bathyarchaeota archaeon]